MDAVLLFFTTYAPLIYILLIIGLLVAIRRIFVARRERHESIYGLELELSRHHLSQAMVAFVILASLVFAEFVLTVFLAPNLPARSVLGTPTINPLTALTPTALLVQGTAGSTPTQFSPTEGMTGCIPGQIMLTSPKPGEEIQGKITLVGTADIPNFGYYKYEFAVQGSDNWSTIQASRSIVQDDTLGTWDTSELPGGDYSLRLVVTDSQANVLPPCIISIRIVPP